MGRLVEYVQVARAFLSRLREPNETHLEFLPGRAKGTLCWFSLDKKAPSASEFNAIFREPLAPPNTVRARKECSDTLKSSH